MLKIMINQIEPGMKLAKDVVLDDGRILLLKGFTIKPRYVTKLQTYNVPFIYVEEERVDPDTISEEVLYEDTFTTIKDVMESVRADEEIDVEELKDTVQDLVHYILNDDMIFMTLTGIRDIDNYTFLHSVDVCIYTIITAKALELDINEIHELALAAILHDIGKCKVPLSILNKPGKLTDQEFEIMKDHSRRGANITRNMEGISEKVSRIILQHHEKWDGSGYPEGTKGHSIEMGARIISIADVFDALTSDRVYRKRFMPHDAAEFLMRQSDSQFDPKLLDCFIESIAVYPQDSIVLLNTGEVARVLPAKGSASIRPKVSIITKKNGPPILTPYEVDLQENQSKYVVDIISL